MVTEVDSGSGSMIFTLSAAVFYAKVIKNPYPLLSVLRDKVENMKNRSNT